MYFLVSDWLWLFPSWYSPSSHKEDRSLLKERTMHENNKNKNTKEFLNLKLVIILWITSLLCGLIFLSFLTFYFTKIVSIYWFNLKYMYTLFISCTIYILVYPCMWWGSNLFLVKFSKLHCWLVLNFLCCQGLGDQRNWESTCKIKSKVSWN